MNHLKTGQRLTIRNSDMYINLWQSFIKISYPNEFEFVVVLKIQFHVDQKFDGFRQIFAFPQTGIVYKRFEYLKIAKNIFE